MARSWILQQSRVTTVRVAVVEAPTRPEAVKDAEERALERVLADPRLPRLDFQPIIDLRRGRVAGYEALARFEDPLLSPPNIAFRLAETFGVGEELEARVVRTALDAVPRLPPHCFLAVNLSPTLLHSPQVDSVLQAAGNLAPLVLELTEHERLVDYRELRAALARHQDAGLTIALDDAGQGYSGLQRMLSLRPQIVKLDRSLTADVDRDEAKLALAEMIGTFAGRLDAWLLVEGIERRRELEAFIRLGVPLAQGYLLGRPAPPWIGLDADLGLLIRETAGRRAHDADVVVGLIEFAPSVPVGRVSAARQRFLADPGLDLMVVVDDHHGPVGLLMRDDALAGRPLKRPVQRVGPTTPVAELAARSMARERGHRFDPSLCCDSRGRYVGLVRLERVVEWLVTRSALSGSGDPSATVREEVRSR